MLKDVKLRLVDHLKAAGLDVTEADLRMWLYSPDNREPKKLIKACQGVVEGFKNPPKDLSEDWDVNSGIEFPGNSLEPLIGSALRMKELNSNEGTHVVVEFRENSQQ